MLHDVLDHAGAGFDIAVRRLIFGRSEGARARSSTESLGHADRIRGLEAIARTWGAASEAELYPDPPAVAPRMRELRPLPGGSLVDATWPSDYAPFDGSITERYLARPENALAAARVALHHAPRPAVIAIHGYRAGQFTVEERVWPLRWLYDRGVDVALIALPFHGVRAAAGKGPFWPGSDPRVTNDGFRQAIHDLRTLARFLRDRGAPSVGVMGMSLGGYTAALLATVEAELSFAIPVIPLASLAGAARDSERYVGTPAEQRLQHDALDLAHRAVSPLARGLRIPQDRVLVVGARGDRITPIAHARELAAHFGAPLEELSGGHLLQFWRGDAFRSIGRLLGRLGVLSRGA